MVERRSSISLVPASSERASASSSDEASEVTTARLERLDRCGLQQRQCFPVGEKHFTAPDDADRLLKRLEPVPDHSRNSGGTRRGCSRLVRLFLLCGRLSEPPRSAQCPLQRAPLRHVLEHEHESVGCPGTFAKPACRQTKVARPNIRLDAADFAYEAAPRSEREIPCGVSSEQPGKTHLIKVSEPFLSFSIHMAYPAPTIDDDGGLWKRQEALGHLTCVRLIRQSRGSLADQENALTPVLEPLQEAICVDLHAWPDGRKAQGFLNASFALQADPQRVETHRRRLLAVEGAVEKVEQGLCPE